MKITVEMVKELREETSAGVLDCRQALETCDGDFEKAVVHLREKGLAAVAKRTKREASEGLIEAYVHPGSQVAVMLELDCETDFVARTDDFKGLAHNLALHIAFGAPGYFTREDIPDEAIESERAIYRAQALEEGKPERIIERIVEGRLKKFYTEACLLEQAFIRDDEYTIDDILKSAIAKMGENIVVRRFARFALGEELAA